MHYALPFLPIEVQTSIREIIALGNVPESAVDLLIARTAKALEDKTTSLQMDLERIETSFEHRYDLIETKLIADNQQRTGGIYEMISAIRNAQLIAHPQISELKTTLDGYRDWGDRLEAAFVAGRDYAADERVRLEAKLNGAIERIEVIESILEIAPESTADS
jgi:hypothetical protein